MTAKPMDIETRIKVLNSVLDKLKQQQAVERELLAAKGDLTAASAALKEKLPLKALQKLQIADLVVTAVGDQPEVARAILSQPGIKTPRDVAKRNVDELTNLIAPVAKKGTKAYKLAKSQAMAINNQSFAREPLTVLHRMTIENELPIADAKVRAHFGAFLKRIPADTDIRTTPICKVLKENSLKGIPEKQRPAVVDQAKALWRTMAITPADAPQALTVLMKTNRTSAFQVGEMPESTFLIAYSEPMMGKEIARQVYTNAINTRIRNEHALIAMRETIRGTGLAAIDGTGTLGKRVENARHLAEKNDIQLNFDTLFGDMDYCECEECRSLCSASAYYVELLNFLRNNNLDPDNPSTNQNGLE
jgi:hypothetical protein